MQHYLYGKIKFFNDEKGYGFITVNPQAEEDKLREIFFHIKRVNGIAKTDLVEGFDVKFQIAEGKDGKEMAVEVSYAD